MLTAHQKMLIAAAGWEPIETAPVMTHVLVIGEDSRVGAREAFLTATGQWRSCELFLPGGHPIAWRPLPDHPLK